jgi:glycine hydroxymethyltransferase
VLDGLARTPEDNSRVEQAVRQEVRELCRRFPIYPGR